MSSLKALDLIHAVPEVEKRLADDMSRKIYEIRMEYAIHKNKDKLIDSIKTLIPDWNYRPELEEFFTLTKPRNVIIFGSGYWGQNNVDLLKNTKYKNLNMMFCDNDSRKWNTELKGIKVISPEEATKVEDSVIILGSVIYENAMRKQLLDYGYPKDRICAPIRSATVGWQYFDVFEPNESEVFVDGGCCNGETALYFSKWATKGYNYIYSFEANPEAIPICKKTFTNNNLKGKVIDKGLWDKETSLHFNIADNSAGSRIKETGEEIIQTIALDDVLNGEQVTFIKMDVEGAEYKALIGSEKTIKKWRPRLAICVYHKPEDIFEIPALLLSMHSDYQFVLRHYMSKQYETVLYAY